MANKFSKNRLHFMVAAFFLNMANLFAQNVGLGTNTPHPSAALDISSSNRGVLFPRVHLFNRDSSNPLKTLKGWSIYGSGVFDDFTPSGLLVFNANNTFEKGMEGKGFYWWPGTPYRWNKIAEPSMDWNLTGNANPANNLLGKTDVTRFYLLRNGKPAGHLFYWYTGFGYSANPAFGSTERGRESVSFGAESEVRAISSNITAFGAYSLHNDTSSRGNVAIGANTLYSAQNVDDNVAVGYNALGFNKSNRNTAIGAQALYTNNNGSHNTGVGFATSVLSNLVMANAIGAEAVATVNNSIVLGGTGAAAVKVGIGVTAPGADLDIMQKTDSFGINLSNWHWPPLWRTFVLNDGHYYFRFRNNVVSYINGTTGAIVEVSDSRFKENVIDMPAVLNQAMQLQAKSYNYKDADDPTPSFGFIAQEVEKIFPQFVRTDNTTGHKAVAYSNFGVVAVKTIQEQQELMKQQDQLINDLKQRIGALEKKKD